MIFWYKNSVLKWGLCAALFVCALMHSQNVMAEDTVDTPNTVQDSVPAATKSSSTVAAPSHWAVFLDAGINWFDGDYKEIDKQYPYLPAMGVGFTYNFNGTWGVGASYAYANYKVFGNTTQLTPKEENTYPSTLLKAQMHRAQAFVMFDIVNMWRPVGEKVFAANLFAGVGMAFFNRSCHYDLYDVDFQTPLSDEKGAFQMTPLFLFGADLQYNINKSFSLGLKTTYNLFTRDDLDNRIKGTNNDGIVDLTLSLRYKIGAKKGGHVSNTPAYTELLTRVDEQLQEKIVETVVKEVVTVREEVLRQEVHVVHRDTVVIESVRVEYHQAPAKKETHYVYYGLNTSTLSDASLNTIQQVAAAMIEDEDLCAEIVGYGDNTGSIEYNEKLTNIRAKNVFDELVNEYDIPAERIVYYSGGVIEGKRKGIYSANRRVEIRVIPSADFQEVKEKAETIKARVPAVSSPATEVDSVTAEKVLTVEDGMTLSGIAFAEYGNASCWMYIYEANKETMSSPDELHLGQKLIIPALTQEQKRLVKSVNYLK